MIISSAAVDETSYLCIFTSRRVEHILQLPIDIHLDRLGVEVRDLPARRLRL
jgi:hypothetical protein